VGGFGVWVGSRCTSGVRTVNEPVETYLLVVDHMDQEDDLIEQQRYLVLYDESDSFVSSSIAIQKTAVN
jgi:hypothetical protein